jgi:hypothetical protein
LDRKIREASGTVPRLDIFAVPDAEALESRALASRVASSPALPLPSPREQLISTQNRVREFVQRGWPIESAGEPLRIEIGALQTEPLAIRVTHHGSGLNPDAKETLERSIGSELGFMVKLDPLAIPAIELTRERGDLPFIAQVATALRDSSGIDAIKICILRPPLAQATADRNNPPPSSESELAAAIDGLLADRRVTTSPASDWSIRFSREDCPRPQPVDEPEKPPAKNPVGAPSIAPAP